MTPVAEVALVALLFGVTATLLVWSLRDALTERFRRDVTRLEHAIWRFTPERVDARPWVAGFYAAAVGVLFVFLLVMPNTLVALVLWGVLVVVPKLAFDRAWSRRRATIDAQLPGVVRQMSSSVGSGMTLAQAIERLGERAPLPIRTEFKIMAGYWGMGADFSSTLEEAKRRLDLQNFSLFASALLVNQRMGGNVTETLDRLANSLESIDQMRRDVHAATAEGRTNIKVLALAPLIMLALVFFMDAEAVGMLFTRALGHLLLGVAAALTLVGTWWAWSIVRADV